MGETRIKWEKPELISIFLDWFIWRIVSLKKYRELHGKIRNNTITPAMSGIIIIIG